MNKNKRIDNHRIKILTYMGDKAQDEKKVVQNTFSKE